METRERILQLLNENGITQKELAEKSGVGAVTISRILNGHFQPKASTLSKIADVFGLSLSEISEDDSFGKKTFKGVRGYVEYLGKIQRIESFKNLEDFYLMVKHNIETIPVEAKVIRADDKKILDHNTSPGIDYERPSDIQQKRIPTVIFDFDKTLVDTSPLEQYSHLYRGKERLSEEWKEGIKEYISHISDCKVYEGINEVIDFLRANDVKIIVVTAGIKMKVMEAAKVFGWTDIIKAQNTFGRHSYGLQTKVTKKDGNSMLFEKALSDMGVEAKDCIAFGNEYDDTVAAQKVGVRAYNCLWGATTEDADRMMIDMPQFTIENPIEIIDIIKGEIK